MATKFDYNTNLTLNRPHLMPLAIEEKWYYILYILGIKSNK